MFGMLADGTRPLMAFCFLATAGKAGRPKPRRDDESNCGGLICEPPKPPNFYQEGKASKYEDANSIEFCEDSEEEISGAGSLFGVAGCAAIFWVTVVSVVVYVW